MAPHSSTVAQKIPWMEEPGRLQSMGSLRDIGKARAELRQQSVTQLCPTLCDPMNCIMPGLPVHHQLLESTQTHVH